MKCYILNRFKASGYSLDDLKQLEPHIVEDIFYPPENLQRNDIPMPDFQTYYDRIHQPGSKVNVSYCWFDYKEKNPNGYED